MLLVGLAKPLGAFWAVSRARQRTNTATSIRSTITTALYLAVQDHSNKDTYYSSDVNEYNNNNDEEESLGAARALLFDDQHRAMGKKAEQEGKLLDPNMTEMKEIFWSDISISKTAKRRKKRPKKSSAGMGFGRDGSKSTRVVQSSSSSSPRQCIDETFDEKTKVLAAAVEEDGVVLIPNVLKRETTKKLRECLLEENEVMRDMIRADPSKSISLFYVPADIHFSTLRGYVLLPFRDSESVAQGPQHVGTIVQATRELLAPGKPLSSLFSRMCHDGSLDSSPQLYDFCALRTEPGAARQVVHSDTPHQDIPGLFCAFVALQNVTMAMGGTMFIPKTHTRANQERLRFDSGDTRAMLKAAQPQYTMLKAGDAAFFDMRTLHAGLPNCLAKDGGATRLLLAITFRNLNAKEALGHKPNLRPGYAGLFTLREFQEELAKKSPFATVGNGLLV